MLKESAKFSTFTVPKDYIFYHCMQVGRNFEVVEVKWLTLNASQD